MSAKPSRPGSTGTLVDAKPAPAWADGSLWYKDAVIYEVHVRAFADSNADGIGDFRGLTSKLDYLQDLGVTALWLLPFYPSPLKDDGYDTAQYDGIHPALRLYLLGALSVRLGDEASATRYAAALDRGTTDSTKTALWHSLAARVRAQLSWRRGDARQTLAELDAASIPTIYDLTNNSPFYSQALERFLREHRGVVAVRLACPGSTAWPWQRSSRAWPAFHSSAC